MRILLLSFALSLVGLVGCGSVAQPDLGGVVDDLSPSPVQDMAMSASGDALLPLAAHCTMNSQCQSNVCAAYKMGTEMLCTLHCTASMAAPMCTSPSSGQCNGMGYCMFPGM